MLLVDENLHAPFVEILRAAGHDVAAVAEIQPGLDDHAVLSLAVRRRATLLTLDTDFGELVVREGLHHHGVILLRVPAPWRDEDRAVFALHVLDQLADRDLTRCLVVATPNRIRARAT